jgi:hypothetical protein
MFLSASQRTPLKSQHLSTLKAFFTSSLKYLIALSKYSQSEAALTFEPINKTATTVLNKFFLKVAL